MNKEIDTTANLQVFGKFWMTSPLFLDMKFEPKEQIQEGIRRVGMLLLIEHLDNPILE